MNKKKPIDILQGKFHYFRGDVELDDENEDLTDRVFSGETIVGGDKKMYWTEDGWKEGEKKQNTNPFRIKKVGDKYEYDFVSYDEWEKIMEKYDYEGDLDGLEKWGEMERKREWEKTSKELRDLIRKRQQRIEKEKQDEYEDLDKELDKMEKSFKDWDTELTKENMTIKLKSFIKDEILKEGLDKKIEGSVNELGDLSKEIEILKSKLKPLTKRYGEIVEEIIPVVKGLHTENVLTNRYVFRIMKKGFERKTVSYREGFLQSLEKLNKQTRIVCERILKETERLSYVKPQISISPIEGVGNTIKKWVNRFKGLVRKVIPSLKQIRNENKKLKRIMVGR